MFLQNTKELINKFYTRYVDRYHTEYGDFVELKIFSSPFLSAEFTFRDEMAEEEYKLTVFVDDKTDELHIINEDGKNITDYSEENEWSDEDIRFIKFGI